MVDFNALMSRDTTYITTNPIDIFEELPKSGQIDNLYHVQAEILQKWFNDLRDERDIVVELNTGGGKTLVGLLMALSTMRETGEGVLYLVENKQLADQVVDQAVDLGIPARAYCGRMSVDADFDNGNSILVSSYQVLFNGKSVFGTRGAYEIQQLGGIVIDDAHASLNAIKKAFSLSIPAEGASPLYKKILGEFKEAFNAMNRSTTYQDFQEGVGSGVVEIPIQYWTAAIERVSSLIRQECRKRSEDDSAFSKDLIFKWPLIKDNLRYCQAIASRTHITIAALYPMLEMTPCFQRARRRIYMSATITDYGDMVRAYDLRGLEESNIIAPKTVAGVGRRMILNLPTEIARSSEFLNFIESEISAKQGIVCLTSRQNIKSEWTGISFSEPIGHEEVSEAVEALKSKRMSSPVSFANRYNGIDLPGDACRILVLHGLPSGTDDVDALMSIYLSESNLMAQRVAQRIEQGLGRGVRGASDHCIVLLEGEDLIEWMRRKRNRKFMSSALTAQLEIGDVISEGLITPLDYCEAMNQDVNSDESWKKFHASKLAKHVSEETINRFGPSFQAACAERRAFAQWVENHNGDACRKLEEKVNSFNGDPSYQGWLLYLASRIALDGSDPDSASTLLQRAHSLNNAIPYIPFHASDAISSWAIDRADKICTAIADSGNVSANQNFDAAVADLLFSANSKAFEEALMQLGLFLGFESAKADVNGVGSDVYWLSKKENAGFVLEAKNDKKDDTPLRKKEAGQLRTAHDWLKQKYPDIEILAVSVHPNSKADRNASAKNLKVLTPENLDLLKEEARLLIHDAESHLPIERAQRVAYEIEKRKLGVSDLSSKFFVSFESDEH
ncbi:DEAD/DEAH box helicase [Paraeggerthella sp.]|uniref:DEAD/DEAH box helicase n=1 Tax=Paraeggerthella sp. TaxID=2897350 RepID=UPI003AB83F76